MNGWEQQRTTYEWRFHEFCWAHLLDPEDTASVVEYEEWFMWVLRGSDPDARY
jgi:hypothetical protein